MKRRKPDIMAILAIVVAFGVLVSVWTQTFLCDVQAATRSEAAVQQHQNKVGIIQTHLR